jgi:hypothetical protein
MSGFGCEDGEAGYNKASKEFKESPTIETYVRLRRERPNVEIEVATTGGLEFVLFHEEQLRDYGIDPDLVSGVLDAAPEAQTELALRLMESIIQRNEKEDTGATHLISRREAISEALVNYLIGVALDGLSWNDDLLISRELIVLIKHQLGVSTSRYIEEQKIINRKFEARWMAGLLIRKGKLPSYRNIARSLGLQASTVKRWFSDQNINFDTAIADLSDEIAESFRRFRQEKLKRERERIRSRPSCRSPTYSPVLTAETTTPSSFRPRITIRSIRCSRTRRISESPC